MDFIALAPPTETLRYPSDGFARRAHMQLLPVQNEMGGAPTYSRRLGYASTNEAGRCWSRPSSLKKWFHLRGQLSSKASMVRSRISSGEPVAHTVMSNPCSS